MSTRQREENEMDRQQKERQLESIKREKDREQKERQFKNIKRDRQRVE